VVFHLSIKNDIVLKQNTCGKHGERKTGMARGNKPNGLIIRWIQLYSTKGWVWREGQGWIFAELTLDELAEFKSYKRGITIPRMRVRLPYSQPICRFRPELSELDNYANWFALCTMPQEHPLMLSRFRLRQIEPNSYEPCGYETGLWPDQFDFCQEAGCNLHIRYAYGWREWGVPNDWRPPLPPLSYKRRVFKERVFIYAFVNEFTQEVYVGQTDNLERRRAEHLRDTKNSDKVVLLQSLRDQGCEPKPIKLEEVAGEKADERESYWTSYYKSQGYKIINRDLWLIHQSE
jgi:GIY-YIG catalytic domain